MEVEKLSERFEDFLIELSREQYLAYSGQSARIDLNRVYKKYEDLADAGIFKKMADMREKSTGDEKRKLSYLTHFVAMFIEGRKTSPLSDEIDEKKASAKVGVDGEEMSYYRAGALLDVEVDRERRRKLYEEVNKITNEINPFIRKFWNKSHSFAVDIGYKNYIEVFRDLCDVDYVSVSKDMNWFVAESGDLYQELLKEIVKDELGMVVNEVEPCDSRYLLNLNCFKNVLPADGLLNVIKVWPEEWGFDATAKGNITYDTEMRERKSPRAFCSCVVVPNEIYLVIFPRGGYSDYASFLHELGHAVHFGYTDRAQPMEYRYLGDNAITESFAFLLEHLLMNHLWVTRYIQTNESGKFIKYILLKTLYMLGRYTAKIDYELIFHKNGDDNKLKEVYKELLERNTLLKQNEKAYLSDIDADMYVSNYIRAWILEALISTYLTNEFDADWFRNPKVRDFLLDLYSVGQKFNATEMATRLGYNCLDVKVLWKRLEDIYNSL
jgi:oligoendopeptidase F